LSRIEPISGETGVVAGNIGVGLRRIH
jgi:hypothetical protein